MYNILFLFVIFVGVVEFRIPGLNYWDEVMLVAVSLYCILKKGKLLIRKVNLEKWMILVVFIIAGIAGNILHPNLQDSGIAIIKDIIAVLKFPVLTIIMFVDRGEKKQTKIIHEAATISRYTINLMLFIAIIGCFINIGVYQNEIRFVKCYQFFFSHPTFMVSSLVMMATVLLADGIKKNCCSLFAIAFLLFLSGRVKGYIMILLIFLIFVIQPSMIKVMFYSIKDKIKIKKRYMVPITSVIIILGYFLGKEKIDLYLYWGLTAARPALYIIGIQLVKDFFPFGSGFGTFASSISGEYYSNVYRIYHIDDVNGMTKDNISYIGDTYPPYVYGQFGITGTFAYVSLLIQIFKDQFQKQKSYNRIIAFLFIWVYALVASTAETYFTNSSAVQFAVVLSVFIGSERITVR